MLEVEDLPETPSDFFPEHPEGAMFQRAFHRAAIPGFQTGCLRVRRTGEVIAILPYFLTDFRLDTLAPAGLWRRVLAPVRLRIACVGHPSSDLGLIQGEVSPAVLTAVNAALARHSSLVAYKGFGPDLPLPGFTRVRGLPVSVLPLRPDYWDALPSVRRKDFRRKLTKASGLRFEAHEGLPPEHVDRVLELYLLTKGRAEIHFETLNRAYFTETGPFSHYLFAFEGERLVGFSQTLMEGGRASGKYLGTDPALAGEHGLYFALVLGHLNAVLGLGANELECGVSSYTFKRHLGCRLQATWNYYRHANPLMNWLLAHMAFLLEPQQNELD